MAKLRKAKPGRGKIYAPIIEKIFLRHYKKGSSSFEFERDEIVEVARELKIDLPKNLGDLIYSFRFRRALPDTILATCKEGECWTIEGAGIARYRFHLGKESWVTPRPDQYRIKIPDATPEIIDKYAMDDEQAVLAKVRYNRLIDVFTGIVAYSLQNHLRTGVKGIGQIEIDELYVGVNKNGQQFIIPVQAKGGRDRLATVQMKQDVAFCAERFPALLCKPVAVQFMAEDVIAMFELRADGDELRVVEEKHYVLVAHESITEQELKEMGKAD